MKILYVARWFPYPADNGAKIRTLNLLRGLSEHHTLDLISFTSEEISAARLASLNQICHSVITVPYRRFKPQRLKAILGFFSLTPRSVIDTDNLEMHAKIRARLQENDYDLVIASTVELAQYVRKLPLNKILEEIELATLYDQVSSEHNPLKKIQRSLMWRKWSRYLANIIPDFMGGTVVSAPERDLVRRVLGSALDSFPIQIIPNGVDTEWYQGDFGAPIPDSLVYTGSLTYSANFDAVQYFLSEIFPLLRAEFPGVTFSVTGKLDGTHIDTLPQYPGVTFTGYIEDIRPAIARSWISIVPLRRGGGTRLKILESLAMGTPVVSTSKGAEGLDLVPGRDIMIADTPSDFAEAVSCLFSDPDLRQSLSQNGKKAMIERYDWKNICLALNRFIEETS